MRKHTIAKKHYKQIKTKTPNPLKQRHNDTPLKNTKTARTRFKFVQQSHKIKSQTQFKDKQNETHQNCLQNNHQNKK